MVETLDGLWKSRAVMAIINKLASEKDYICFENLFGFFKVFESVCVAELLSGLPKKYFLAYIVLTPKVFISEAFLWRQMR